MYKIYLIYCEITNKYYIGRTKQTIQKRWRGHIQECRYAAKTTNYFKNAIRKHGKENFTLYELDTVETLKESKEKETLYILLYRSFDREIGYNGTYGGEGEIATEETRKKISLSQKIRFENGDVPGNYRYDLVDEEIVKEYETCLNFKQVGLKLGTSATQIRKRYLRVKPEEKDKKGPNGRRLFKYREDFRGSTFKKEVSTDRIIEEYRQCGNFEEVARRLNTTVYVVSNRYRKLFPEDTDQKHNIRYDVSPEQVSFLYDTLQNYVKVAETLNISYSTAVRKHDKYLKEKGLEKKVFDCRNLETVENVLREFEDCKNYAEVGRRLGINQQTARRIYLINSGQSEQVA